jgi:hypothetical protein
VIDAVRITPGYDAAIVTAASRLVARVVKVNDSDEACAALLSWGGDCFVGAARARDSGVQQRLGYYANSTLRR